MTTRAQAAANAIIERVLDDLDDEISGEDMLTHVRALLVEHFGAVACNADENEPIFTVAASEKAASAAVRMFGVFAVNLGGSADRVRESIEVEAAMLGWRAERGLDGEPGKAG